MPSDNSAQDNSQMEPIYVLFEGPWLLFESAPGLPTLTAVTVGAQMDNEQAGFVHSCAVQTWHDGEQVSETTLPCGDQWIIRASNYRTRKFTRVMADAFDDQPIAWIPKGCNSHAYPGDRTIVLPIPTSMHFAGILRSASASGSGILSTTPANPHTVAILKYMPEISGDSAPALTLYQGDSGLSYSLEAGNHLVFRLQHTGLMTMDTNREHVTQAFTHLRSHLSVGDSIGFQFDGDSAYYLGDAQGLSFDELGLDPNDMVPPNDNGTPNPMPMPMAVASPHDGRFANCCGGGGVSGGGGTEPPPPPGS